MGNELAHMAGISGSPSTVLILLLFIRKSSHAAECSYSAQSRKTESGRFRRLLTMHFPPMISISLQIFAEIPQKITAVVPRLQNSFTQGWARHSFLTVFHFHQKKRISFFTCNLVKRCCRFYFHSSSARYQKAPF